MQHRIAAPLVALILLALAAPASAGVLVESEETDSFGTTATTMSLSEDRLRVDGTDGHGGTFTFIFRADRDEMWMVDAARNVYAVIDRPMLDQMRKQFEAARQAMQQQLAQLPPEERERIKQQSGGRFAAPDERERPTYKKTATDVAVGPWKATRYEVTEDGATARAIYTVPWKKIAADRSDFAALDAYGRFAAAVTGESSELFSLSGKDGTSGFEGFPIKTEILDGSGSITLIKTVRKQKFEDKYFELPSGCRRVDMMEFAGPQGVPSGQ